MSCTTDKKDTDRDTAANDTKKPELQNNWKALYGKKRYTENKRTTFDERKKYYCRLSKVCISF